MMVTRRPAWAFSQQTARQVLAKHFGTAGLEGFRLRRRRRPTPRRFARPGPSSIISPKRRRARWSTSTGCCRIAASGTLEIDEASRRSLEITRTIRDGRREGSLLWVLDRTVTAMGSRLLAEWVANPLTDAAAIGARLDAVEELVGDQALCDELHESAAAGLRRRAAAGPRDHRPGQPARPELPGPHAADAAGGEGEADGAAERAAERAGGGDRPLPRAAGDARRGAGRRVPAGEPRGRVHPRRVSAPSWTRCASWPTAASSGSPATRPRRPSGRAFPRLKVGFNKVFGYYIEITNAHREKIPADYIRKQTIKNAERYITPELKEYEEKVLTADEKAKELEYALFLELRDVVAADRRRMQATAAALAQIDVLVALAELARQRNYCRPEIVEEPVLRIVDGRHPVLDVVEPEGKFVPNDTLAGQCEAASGSILLITGPNMAGKSTYIRQVALLTLMAQIGSFVPAREATIGVADRIFARVGASDELTRGQSTFMVEMTETARILNTATPRSLVILDEIGRGTSTYDGMSLAWSVVEYLHEHVGCRTLFATHYHELTDLEKSLAGREEPERGGPRVAGRGGLPAQDRRRRGRQELRHPRGPAGRRAARGDRAGEGDSGPIGGRASRRRGPGEDRPAGRRSRRRRHLQLTLFGPAEHPLVDELRRLDLNNVTPIQAIAIAASNGRTSLHGKEQSVTSTCILQLISAMPP